MFIQIFNGRMNYPILLDLQIIGFIFIMLRVITLGLERIFIKFLEEYESEVVASIFFIFASFWIIPIFLFIEWEDVFLTNQEIIIILTISIIYALGFYFYVAALGNEDASIIAPLYNSSLLWLLIIGAVFLDNQVGTLRIIGAIIMFTGVFLLYPGNFIEKIKAIKSSKGSVFMIIGSIFFAIGRAVDSFLITTLEVNVYLYAFLSNFLIGFYILIFVIITGKKSKISGLINQKWKTLASGSMISGWSFVFLLFAFSLLEVTVAEPLTLLSIFFTALFAKLLLDEEIKERLFGMLIMVIGAILLIGSS